LQYVLKIETKLPMDMKVLNEKLCFVEEKWKGGRVMLIESNWERLVLLARQPNSVFGRGRAYPLIKYYLAVGMEEQTLREMQTILRNLQVEFEGLRLCLGFEISRPYPVLGPLLQWIISQGGESLPFVIFSTERPFRVLHSQISRIQASRPATPTPFDSLEAEMRALSLQGGTGEDELSIDPMGLLRELEIQSGGHIKVDDFLPISVVRSLELVMRLLGYGHLLLRPSPYCGFVVALVQIKSHATPIAINRIFDVKQFHRRMLELAPTLEGAGGIGLSTLRDIKNLFSSCQLPSFALPDITSYLTSRSKLPEAYSFIRKMQFFVVHNNMDLAASDLLRRCDCVSMSRSTSGPTPFAPNCTGCL
jgi:hypothetical protein